MADYIDRQATIGAIHSAIYPFFCGAEDGDTLSEDEKLILSVNKTICKAIKALPSADELTIVTEYCRKRNLVIITMESFRVLQAYYNKQNGMGGEQDG